MRIWTACRSRNTTLARTTISFSWYVSVRSGRRVSGTNIVRWQYPRLTVHRSMCRVRVTGVRPPKPVRLFGMKLTKMYYVRHGFVRKIHKTVIPNSAMAVDTDALQVCFRTGDVENAGHSDVRRTKCRENRLNVTITLCHNRLNACRTDEWQMGTRQRLPARPIDKLILPLVDDDISFTCFSNSTFHDKVRVPNLQTGPRVFSDWDRFFFTHF